MKVTGLGMELPLDDFRVDIIENGITVSQNVDVEKYYFKEYDFHDGYKYAVCGLVPDFEDDEFVSFRSGFKKYPIFMWSDQLNILSIEKSIIGKKSEIGRSVKTKCSSFFNGGFLWVRPDSTDKIDSPGYFFVYGYIFI